MKCWGDNASGILGIGSISPRGTEPGQMGKDLPAVNLGEGVQVSQIVTGSRHTCARLTDGQVKCWGENSFGQLGLGDTNARGFRADQMGRNLPFVNLGSNVTVRFLTAGAFHTCAVLMDFSVKCWGLNSSGQLGTGDTITRGTSVAQMGDALPRVFLGRDQVLARGSEGPLISAGGQFTCAAVTTSAAPNGSVKCWGANGKGQLGLGIAADSFYAMSELETVNLGFQAGVTALSTGSEFACARLTSGSLKCWGANQFGQLGVGDSQNRGNSAASMGAALNAVDLPPAVATKDLLLGGSFACVIAASDSRMRCWGKGEQGQLGTGKRDSVGTSPGQVARIAPVSLSGPKNLKVLQASLGEAFACAVLADRRVRCWGANRQGQLGQGSITDRGDKPDQMGRLLPVTQLG